MKGDFSTHKTVFQLFIMRHRMCTVGIFPIKGDFPMKMRPVIKINLATGKKSLFIS